MKKIKQLTIKSLMLCISLFVAEHASAQIQRISSDFGEMAVQNPEEPCIPPSVYKELKEQIATNVSRLAAEGNLINSVGMLVPPQLFDWPLTHETNFLGNDYFFIQNYIDHAPAAGVILDYMCGTRSYDLPNYDHQGTDICIGPYWWKMMNDMKVRVIAAAPGQIVTNNDGNPDTNCVMGPSNANSITIQHADGTRAFYFHMKEGSVTSKVVGDYVTTGEYLGYVASSGSSTAPHLHFEVQDSSGNVIDPWVGNCNPDIVSSRWISQKPYPNSGIMSILTMNGFASGANCYGIETVPLSNHFAQGASFRIEIHLRDLVPGTVQTTRIYSPTNVLLDTATDTVVNFRAATFYSHTYNLANNAAIGTYRIQVDYQGKKASHYFTVGCPPAYNLSGAVTGMKGYITGENITTTQTIAASSSNNIWYEADDYIQANVGFRATAGCKFRARIDNCAQNSSLAKIETTTEKNFTLKANPSITTDHTKLSLETVENGPVSITIYDLTGRKVQTVLTEANLSEGTHEFELSTVEYPSGIYLCTAQSGISKSQCKIVVQK